MPGGLCIFYVLRKGCHRKAVPRFHWISRPPVESSNISTLCRSSVHMFIALSYPRLLARFSKVREKCTGLLLLSCIELVYQEPSPLTHRGRPTTTSPCEGIEDDLSPRRTQPQSTADHCQRQPSSPHDKAPHGTERCSLAHALQGVQQERDAGPLRKTEHTAVASLYAFLRTLTLLLGAPTHELFLKSAPVSTNP